MYIRETEYNERKREQAHISYASTLKMLHIMSVCIKYNKNNSDKTHRQIFTSTQPANMRTYTFIFGKKLQNKVFEFIFTCLREVAMISVSVKVWLDF